MEYQINDYVFINEDKYIIKIITSDGIYISLTDSDILSFIIYDHVSNTWKVQGYNLPHIITFEKNQELKGFNELALTGITEIDEKILLQLDNNSLNSICQTNEYINSLCLDDKFWKLKVEQDFNTLTEYKPMNETYKDQYIYLLSIGKLAKYIISNTNGIINTQNINIPKNINDMANTLIEHDRVDGLIILSMFGYNPTIKNANIAAKLGNIHVLNWIKLKDVYPDDNGILEAVINNKIETLNWIQENHPTLLKILTPEYINSIIMITPSSIDNVLDWLKQRNMLNLNILDINTLVLYGYIHTLNWLSNQNPPIYPDVDGANMVTNSEEFSVHNNRIGFNWLMQHGIYPNNDGAVGALSALNIDVLKWFDENNLLPVPFKKIFHIDEEYMDELQDIDYLDLQDYKLEEREWISESSTIKRTILDLNNVNTPYVQ